MAGPGGPDRGDVGSSPGAPAGLPARPQPFVSPQTGSRVEGHSGAEPGSHNGSQSGAPNASPSGAPNGAPRAAQNGAQPTDRAAIFAAGPSRIPRTVIVAVVVAITVLGLGGVALDHFFPGPVGSSATTTLPGEYPPPLQTTPAEAQNATGNVSAPQLPASSAALMDLQRLKAASAPGFSLTDQHGGLVSLAAFRGRSSCCRFSTLRATTFARS